jgi:hypothetical protein
MNRKPNIVRDAGGALVWLDVSTAKFPDAETLVDRTDLDRLLSAPFGRWAAIASPSGGRNSSFYVQCHLQGGGTIKLHRAVLGLKTGDGVHASHLNHNTFDNRRANLVATTNRLNMRHGFDGRPAAGCSWHRGSSKWQAQVSLDRRLIHLGYFAAEADARARYAAANSFIDAEVAAGRQPREADLRAALGLREMSIGGARG